MEGHVPIRQQSQQVQEAREAEVHGVSRMASIRASMNNILAESVSAVFVLHALLTRSIFFSCFPSSMSVVLVCHVSHLVSCPSLLMLLQ